MKDFLGGVLGVGMGAVGCVLYVAFYGFMLVLMLVVGIKIFSWIF